MIHRTIVGVPSESDVAPTASVHETSSTRLACGKSRVTPRPVGAVFEPRTIQRWTTLAGAPAASSGIRSHTQPSAPTRAERAPPTNSGSGREARVRAPAKSLSLRRRNGSRRWSARTRTLTSESRRGMLGRGRNGTSQTRVTPSAPPWVTRVCPRPPRSTVFSIAAHFAKPCAPAKNGPTGTSRGDVKSWP